MQLLAFFEGGWRPATGKPPPRYPLPHAPPLFFAPSCPLVAPCGPCPPLPCPYPTPAPTGKPTGKPAPPAPSQAMPIAPPFSVSQIMYVLYVLSVCSVCMATRPYGVAKAPYRVAIGTLWGCQGTPAATRITPVCRCYPTRKMSRNPFSVALTCLTSRFVHVSPRGSSQALTLSASG